jgi:hypothetical protein
MKKFFVKSLALSRLGESYLHFFPSSKNLEDLSDGTSSLINGILCHSFLWPQIPVPQWPMKTKPLAF